MKQRFSLEEYLADPSRKVVTRDGKHVRIICTDADRKNPIVALVKEGTDKIFCYQQNGMLYDKAECNNDLFFDSVKMHGWVNLYRDDDGFSSLGYLRETEESAISEINEKSDRYKHIATIKVTWEEEQE